MKPNWIKMVCIMLVIGFMAAPLAFAGEKSITGTVEQTDQGIVISAADGDTYLVSGQDLAPMVGKTVKATGTLEESDAGKTLTIISVEEVNE